MTVAARFEAPGAANGALSESRATLALAWPLVVAQFATIALNTTDIVMMGWLGPRELAGGSLAVALFYPFFMFGTGAAMAAAPLVAQAVGARRRGDLRRAVRQALWIVWALSALLAPAFLFAEPVFLALGQDPAIADFAARFLRFAGWMIPGALTFVVLRALVSAHGETRVVLVISLFGVAFNATACWALMFGRLGFPPLGIAGAGVATALTHTLMCLLLLGHVLRSPLYRRYALFARFLRGDAAKAREILRIGVPIGMTLAAESGLFAVAAVLMGWLGPDALAAHAVALQIAAIAFMAPLGLSHATTIRVGLAHGEGRRDGVRRAGWTSIGMALAFMSGSATLFWFAPEPLVSLFLDPGAPGNAAPYALAVSYLGVAALFQLVDGAQVTAAAALRGVSDTTAPMAIALGGYWLIGLPTAWALGFPAGLGGIGVWLGLATGLAAAAAVLTARFWGRTRG